MKRMSTLLEVIDRLSPQNKLDADLVGNACASIEPSWGLNKLGKELRSCAIAFRKCGKYGRLRSVVLVAATITGERGLGELESSGILLAPRDATAKFIQFLNRLGMTRLEKPVGHSSQLEFLLMKFSPSY
jgi:hypothetical protein